MQSLKNMKGKEQFKGISIRDDYTVTERNVIKEFVNKAKERNDSNRDGFTWQVCGNPKRDLYLKRFCTMNITKTNDSGIHEEMTTISEMTTPLQKKNTQVENN